MDMGINDWKIWHVSFLVILNCLLGRSSGPL
jgi:hypothetical protein